MEKTLSLSHGEFRLVEPHVSRMSIPSYGEKELEQMLQISGKDAGELRASSYLEYVGRGFPKWKRASLESMELPPLDTKASVKTEGGIHFRSMNSITGEDLSIINRLSFEGSDRKFVSMGDAFFNSGSVIDVKRVDRTAAPVVITVEGDTPTIMSNLFVLDKQVELTVVIRNKTGSVFSLMNNRFFVDEGSSLNLLFINEADADAFVLNNSYYLLSSNAQLNMFDVNLSGKVVVPSHVSRLNGDSAVSNNWALYSATDSSVFDLSYKLIHSARNTMGLIDGIGVLGGTARSVFRGTIDIDKGAKSSRSSEHSDALLLSKKAVSDAIPSLSVKENDVEASHAATVGSIDQDAVYYLQNRGLTQDEAERLIVSGKFDPLIERIREVIGGGIDGGVRVAIIKRLGSFSCEN